MIELKVPMFPESVADGTLAQWNKNEGDFVNEGDIVAEIETDKVVMEVPATVSGVLTGIKKQEGDIVLSQEHLANIDTDASLVSTEKEEPKQESKPAAKDSGVELDVKAPVFPESVADGTISEWHKKEGETVAEGDVLAEIETDKVVLEVPAIANGVLAKIVKQAGDTVLSAEVIAKITEGGSAPVVAKEEVKTTQATTSSSDANNPHLVPSARKAFNASGLDSASGIVGTGKKGRITSEDVKKAASQESSVAAPVIAQGPRFEKRVKMTRLRQTIANRLVDVQHTNAILTTFNEVDMTAVMELRKKYKEMFIKEHDTKLGFMSFFIKAATEALKKFPDVNASIDGDEIVYHNYFDIGIAVGTDRGLVVPVLRDTDTKSLADLENDVLDKAIKGRDGKLNLDDMKGGTFTITNGGTYGSMLSTPIINSPQSAILGMHNIVERPMVVGGEIKIRPIMYLALSYDHRIIDGGTSVKFLKMIKELLEDPNRILLQV